MNNINIGDDIGIDGKYHQGFIRDVPAGMHVNLTGKFISANNVLAKTKAAFEMPVFAPVAA